MKNVKIFIGGIIFCLCMFVLQSYSNSYEITQITKCKYFYNPTSKQNYTLIITESTSNFRSISVHTQIVPGIIKPYK